MIGLDFVECTADGVIPVELQFVYEAVQSLTLEVALHLREAGLDRVRVRRVRDVVQWRDLQPLVHLPDQRGLVRA